MGQLIRPNKKIACRDGKEDEIAIGNLWKVKISIEKLAISKTSDFKQCILLVVIVEWKVEN